MKENLTELVFILDRSGSMIGLAKETIQGFNSFIERQKQELGDAFLTTILFDNQYEVLHNRVDIKEVKPLTSKEYYARGMTAYLDALGRAVNSTGEKLSNLPEEDRPSKVLFVVTTDGYENASKEFTKAQIKDMVLHQQEKYSWEFIFLGANIDAVEEAESIGIFNAANYSANDEGVMSTYRTLDSLVSDYRTNGKVNEDWSNKLK